MDSMEEGCGVDVDSNRTRKFGLPGWMTSNMERLNYSVDFEQYASSPPEGEGFLSEHYGGLKNETPIPTMAQVTSETTHTMLPRIGHDSTRWRSLMSDHDDHYSSPDSTPCATPEPSPVVRRKVSIPHPNDTILTNPGRWFYMGKLQKLDCNTQVDKENMRIPRSCDEADGSIKSKKNGFKLVISNFDLNAVSPNSW